MRKTHYRDYATEAFRFLAREKSAQEYKSRIWNEALELHRQREENVNSGLPSPTEGAIMQAEAALYDASASIRDLDAAEWAITVIEKMRGLEAAKALRQVYMADAHDELMRGDIARRTAMASIEIPASEATIYRWLALARQLFAEKRGLRL